MGHPNHLRFKRSRTWVQPCDVRWKHADVHRKNDLALNAVVDKTTAHAPKNPGNYSNVFAIGQPKCIVPQPQFDLFRPDPPRTFL